jgi:hypothetical protein
MSIQSKLSVCLLSLALSPVALAQETVTESNAVTHQVRAAEVLAVYGDKVLVKEANGDNEYTVPEGFKWQLDGQPITIDQLRPGMKVSAVITDKVTTRQVKLTRVASATVMQIAPGGIVVKNAKGELRSYNFKDSSGNDIRFIRDHKEMSLRNVKQGERLTGTIVTTLPPQMISQREVEAKAVAPAPAPAPVEVAAATPPVLPRTASPLPLLGLIAALSAGVALILRGARAGR